MAEPKEPTAKRAVAFIDGQNLFHAVKAAFGYTSANYDVRKLAQAICDSRGWWLAGVHFYTGIPSVTEDRDLHRFWEAKIRSMESDGVNVVTRNLVPRKQNPDGTWREQKEKGIDARLSLDAVKFYNSNRFVAVVLIFSQDQDLAEAAHEISEFGARFGHWVQVASVFPSNTDHSYGIKGTLQIEFDQELYDLCRDDIPDINPFEMSKELNRLRHSFAQEQQRRSALDSEIDTERAINTRLQEEAEKLQKDMSNLERLQRKIEAQAKEKNSRLESEIIAEREQQVKLQSALMGEREASTKLQGQIKAIATRDAQLNNLITEQVKNLSAVAGTLGKIVGYDMFALSDSHHNAIPTQPSEQPRFLTPAEKQTESESLLRRGVERYNQRNYIEAEVLFRQAIEMTPRFDTAYNNLGNALSNQGRYSEAEAAFRRVTELNPVDVMAFTYLGNMLFSQGYYSKAEAAYRRAIKLKPDFATVHFNLGMAARNQHRYAKAETAFRKAIEIKSDYAIAYFNLGDVFFKREKIAEALVVVEEAVRLQPEVTEYVQFLELLTQKLAQQQEEPGSENFGK